MNNRLHNTRVTCAFSHESYEKDFLFLKDLVKESSNGDEILNVFINVHKPEYLRNLCHASADVLPTFLKQSPSWPLIRRVHAALRTILELNKGVLE